MQERKINITAGGVSVTATLNGSPTADQVWDALPVSGSANIWGDEIYFGIPVKAEAAKDATDEVELGAVAYWPPGNALCLFFGPTPASIGDEPRVASPANVLGKIDGDPTVLKQVRSGSRVTVEKA